MSKMVNLTGQKFGDWEVLEFDKFTKRGARWKCKCTGCNRIISVLSSSLLHSGSKRCVKCSRRAIAYHNRKPVEELAINSIYIQYRNNAKRRNIEFNLSKPELKRLVEMSCYYCGIQYSNSFNGDTKKVNRYNHPPYFYNGIDRLDNSKNYDTNNCVPCCRTCNHAKATMTYNEFISWIDRIIMFRNNK